MTNSQFKILPTHTGSHWVLILRGKVIDKKLNISKRQLLKPMSDKVIAKIYGVKL